MQDLSLDEVAAEAGVSRGLLFHYFPTKTDYHRAVVEAARRRVARNVSPDDGVVGDPAVRQVVERFLDQVARRRESYVALVLGRAPIARSAGDEAPASVREHVAALVLAATALPGRGLRSSTAGSPTSRSAPCSGRRSPAAERDAGRAALVDHCTRALSPPHLPHLTGVGC